MSTEQFNKKLEQCRKLTVMIKRDLKHRQDRQKRGQTTYQVDSQIRGSLSELNELVSKSEIIFANFRANPKDFGLTNKEIEKRSQQFQVISNEASAIKRQYDSCFVKSSREDLMNESPQNKPNFNEMNHKQLQEHKKKQEQQEDQALDQLIGVVKNVKKGNQAISTQLHEQDSLLNTLDAGIDSNTQNMGRVKKNMMKLLDESSNCCLVSVVVIELVAIFLIMFLW